MHNGIRVALLALAAMLTVQPARGQSTSPADSEAATPLRAWVSLGAGAANGGRAMAAGSLWLELNHVAVGARVSDAQTPLAVAGSTIKGTAESSLLVGVRATPDQSRVSLLIAAGMSGLLNSQSGGDGRVLQTSWRERARILDADVAIRMTDHFGLALSAFKAQGRSSTYSGAVISLRVGRLLN